MSESINIKAEVLSEDILLQTTKESLLSADGNTLQEKALNLIVESISIESIFNDDGEVVKEGIEE